MVWIEDGYELSLYRLDYTSYGFNMWTLYEIVQTINVDGNAGLGINS